MKLIKLFSIVTLGFSFACADALLLNEYNAVAPDQQLKNNGYDTHFGDINGNGSSWIELVVNEDYLDIRGARLEIKKSGGVHVLSATFPDNLEFAYLRKGTIITISNEPTDLSYSPISGNDWTINLNVNDLTNKNGVFEISDRTMDISIVSIEDTFLMRHSGEVVKGWGIDNKEVFKLKKAPSSSIEPNDPAYGDDYPHKQIISTFGSPNKWIDVNDNTNTQNFSNLRNMTLENSINKMILLNEYNAVASNKKLKKYGTDTFFGRIKGNGGSWVELVILKDKTDLRNSILKISDNNSIYRGKLPNIDILSKVRSGTILTISEEPTDLSYNPFDACNADWTLNINKNDLTTIEGSFFTSHNNLSVSMVSGSGDITIMPESGEAIVNSNTIGKKEIFKLKKDPSNSITPTDSTYGDDFNEKARSTFGSPNHWKTIQMDKLITQNFNDLRVVALKENFRRHKSSLLLNEYSAVAPCKYLKDNGDDTYFGRVSGNGGSWLEMVVTRDYLNLQEAKIKIKENCADTFSASFPTLLPLAYLRKGTIITISNEPTDITYSPFAPHSEDWKMNININDLTNRVGVFDITSNDIIVSIANKDNTKLLLSPTGEGVWGNHNIDNQEVYKLKAEPNLTITPYSINYGDDNDTEALSSYFNTNRWYNGGTLHTTQKFTLREDLDLNEIGGIVLSNVVGLEALRDAESLQYIPINNSLWITDDDSHHVYEMDLTTHEIKTVFNDFDLGSFTNGDIQDHCENHLGACDIESVAYNKNGDTLYIFTGQAPGDPVIFKLTRPDTNSTFALTAYNKLNGIEYPATTFIGNDFIVASGKSLYTYNFDTNQRGSTALYTTPTGKIVGLAYDENSNTLWVTTSNFELIKVNWSTKETQAVYKMRDNGVYDPRGIEWINNKLYILEGINNKAKADEAIAPIGHPLKNAIHIYQLP